ncbi:MAG: L-lactate permease [Ginsengibacter sp.]
MHWTQINDPFNHLWLSITTAVLPVLFIFWALLVKKMKGYKASLIATGIALIIAIAIYRMPVSVAILSTSSGVLYGLFPICWLIIAALFLFNITVESGQFEVMKHFMASISSDRRLQVLLIAFSFGSFLEGTAGFGAPVAITVEGDGTGAAANSLVLFGCVKIGGGIYHRLLYRSRALVIGNITLK